jgi:hypothetical protein
VIITDFEGTAFAGRNPVGAIRTNSEGLKSLLARDGHLRTLWFVYTETTDGEHYSPRHRHNFDQVRIGLAGVSHYGKHVLRERMIAYFPEGTFYGPHTIRTVPSKLAALQFDGPSRSGYLPYARIEAATRALKERGEFRKGVYHPNEGKAMEAFQAAWEEATGTRAVYPKARFDEPIFMHLDAFPWSPSAQRGVATKSIASFGECGLRLGLTKLDGGAVRAFGDPVQSTIAFVLDGEAALSDRSLSRYSAVLLEPGEALELGARSAALEVIEIMLPELAPATRPATDERALAAR